MMPNINTIYPVIFTSGQKQRCTVFREHCQRLVVELVIQYLQIWAKDCRGAITYSLRDKR